jgi:DNA-binding NarL/FixJ family response regulator
MVEVLVVEDQPANRKALVDVLRQHPPIRVWDAAETGEKAVALLRRRAPAPDVILMDLGLPGMDGIEATRRARSVAPESEVLVVTVFEQLSRLKQALRAGAAGYVLKGTPGHQLATAVQTVAEGGAVLEPGLGRRLLRSVVPACPWVPPSLTDRETEVLHLVARGCTNRDVSRVLGIALPTVRTHMEHIFRKLDVATRGEAVAEGLRFGLL